MNLHYIYCAKHEHCAKKQSDNQLPSLRIQDCFRKKLHKRNAQHYPRDEAEKAVHVPCVDEWPQRCDAQERAERLT